MMFESVWFRHPRVWWLIGAGMWLATVTMWLINRDVPSVFGVQYSVPEVAPGGTVHIVIPVQRNLSRKCSIDTDRSFIDSTGASEVLYSDQHTPAASIEKREAESPGYLSIKVRTPEHAQQGPAIIRTVNQYVCPFNPTTYFWPIENTWEFKLIIKDVPK